MKYTTFCLFCLYFFTFSVCYAQPITFTSTAEQTTLIELFTSEGCSSCPPADKWLSQYKSNPALWKQVVPVAFHVDYWDYLGWKDRFSNAAFSNRQRVYAEQRHIKTVYTPGIIRNGREWRGWFRGRNFETEKTKTVGIIAITVNGQNIESSFTSSTSMTAPLYLNIAQLGFNVSNKIEAGENVDKILKHDFVVLDFQKIKSKSSQSPFHWRTSRNIMPGGGQQGIAVWVSSVNDQTPIQAIGGWLTVQEDK